MDFGSLTCVVCNIEYDTCNREPRIIPTCGHNLCLVCLSSLLNDSSETFKCPSCKIEIKLKKKYPTNFPKNLPLISMIEQRKSQQICQIHHSNIEMICLDCKEKICNKCALRGNHRGHDIDVISDFIQDINDRVSEIDQWRDRLNIHLVDIESHLESEKKRYIDEVNYKFNAYIGKLLMKKDQIAEEINAYFVSLTEARMFKLKENLSEFTTRWKNERCFDSAFKILSEDLKAIIKEINGVISIPSREHVENSLFYVNLTHDEDFMDTISKVCSFGESIKKDFFSKLDYHPLEKPKLISITIANEKQSLPLEISSDSRVSELKEKISSILGVPAKFQWLIFGIKNLINELSIEEYSIQNGDVIVLKVKSSSRVLTIRDVNGENLCLQAKSHTSIAELKKEIEKKIGISETKQILCTYTGVIFENHMQVKDYEIDSDSAILLVS